MRRSLGTRNHRSVERSSLVEGLQTTTLSEGNAAGAVSLARAISAGGWRCQEWWHDGTRRGAGVSGRGLLHPESDGNLAGDIEVSDGEEDHVGVGVESAEAAGAVVDQARDAIEAFGDGVGEAGADEGEDAVEMVAKRVDELSQGWQAAAQGSARPAFEEALGGPGCLVGPEVFKFIFQAPGAVDAAVGAFEFAERARVLARAVRGVTVEDPAQALECQPLGFVRLAPLFFADLIDGAIEGFDDMEAVDDEGSIGAVVADGAQVSFAHVAAGPADVTLLIGSEGLGEEAIDGVAALTFTDPDDARPVQIIDEGGVLMTFGIGDLIDAEGLQVTDAVPLPDPRDGAVQQVGERGRGNAEQLRRGFLRHDLAVAEQEGLEPVADEGVPFRPGRLLAAPAVRRAADLARAMQQPY